jgi:acyl-coenzyme A thioesterase PaaI-like protein
MPADSTTEHATERNDIRRAWLDEDEAGLSPARIAKHRLTEQIRRLIDASFQLDVGDSGYPESTTQPLADSYSDRTAPPGTTDQAFVDHLERLAAEAADLADRLSGLPRIPRETSADGLNASQARRLDALLCERSPINGRANPLAPPVRMWADGELVRAEAYFTAPYEGPPGRVHGAWVAACFDEILGCAQGASGTFGFTGTLTVTMRRATPLYTTVTYEAGLSHQEGRKLTCWGKCYADGVLTAEAAGIFVVPVWAS